MLVLLIAGYLVIVRSALYRRIRCSWEELAKQVDPGSGSLAAFRNAGVLLQMIDYACHADRPIDSALAESLRREARAIRLGAIWVASPRG